MNISSVLENYFESAGGKEKWAALKTYYLNLKISIFGTDNYSHLYKGKDGWVKSDFELLGKRIITIIKNDKIIFPEKEKNLYNLLLDVNPKYVANYFLLPFILLESLDLGSEISLNIYQKDEDYYQICIKKNQQNLYFLINKNNYLVKAYQEQKGVNFLNFWFSVYKNFEGLLVPTVMESEIIDVSMFNEERLSQKMRMELLDFHINPDFSPEVFSVPV